MANALTTLTDLSALFKKAEPQIKLAVAKHLTPERLMRTALTVFSRNSQLQECSGISILGCVVQAGELGLELSGPLGQCYMVPRFNKHAKGKEACFQVGYRGFYALAQRSGQVRSFAPRIVYAKDEFSYQLGTDPKIHHVPYRGEDDPGDAVAYYAVLSTISGGTDFEVMSRAQMVRHRDRYAGGSTFWRDHFDQMALKTVVRQLAKRAPLSVDFQKSAMYDELAEQGLQSQTLQDLGLEGQEPIMVEQYQEERLTDEQKAELLRLVQEKQVNEKTVRALLDRHGAKTVEKLTDNQAQLVIIELRELGAPKE